MSDRPRASRYPFLRPEPPRLSLLHDELQAVEESGLFTNFGPAARRFELDVVDRCFEGVGSSVTVANATLGLVLAIGCLVEKRATDEPRYALMPAFTFAAPAHAALWNGLTPLFCDIDPNTWLAAEAQEEALLDEYRDRVGVIVPQTTFGHCPDLTRYERLERFYGVPVVVDAASALGSTSAGGQQFGTGSRLVIVFSMHATKTFATAEGGIVYSSAATTIERVRAMSNFGFGRRREATLPGLNAKLPEVIAVLANAKLRELDLVIERRTAIGDLYRHLLSGLQLQELNGVRPSYQFFPVALPSITGSQRDRAVSILGARGIEVATYFSPHLAQHDYFADHSAWGDLSATDDVASRILSLPVYNSLQMDDVRVIATSVLEVLQEIRAGEDLIASRTYKVT